MRAKVAVIDDSQWKQGLHSWGICLLCCALLFGLDRIGWTKPLRVGVETGVWAIYQPTKAVFTYLTRPVRWIERGVNASARIADLELRLSQAAVDSAKLASLEAKVSQLENMVQSLPNGKKAAFITQMYASNGNIMIAAGSQEEVKRDQYVTDQHGILIGKIKDIGEHVSILVLPGEVGFRLPLQTASGKAKGVLELTGTQLVMSGILQTEGLNEGEIVVTSGLDGVVPPGIVVGQVTKVNGSPSDPTKTAEISRLSSREGWAAVW